MLENIIKKKERSNPNTSIKPQNSNQGKKIPETPKENYYPITIKPRALSTRGKKISHPIE